MIVSKERWHLLRCWDLFLGTGESLQTSPQCLTGSKDLLLHRSQPNTTHILSNSADPLSSVWGKLYSYFTDDKTDPCSIGSVAIITRLIPLAMIPRSNVFYLPFYILTRISSVFIALISSLNISIIYHVLIPEFTFYNKHSSYPL